MPSSVRSPFAVVRTVFVAVVLAVGTAALAQAAAPALATLADGSEVVVTDRHGEHLIGYGRVEQRELRLSIAPHDDDDGLAVTLISPAGEVSTLVGRFADDGLRVRAPGAAADVTLLAWMSDRGVALTLERVARARDDDDGDDGDDEDDHRDGAPPSTPSDDDGDDPDDDADDDDPDEDEADEHDDIEDKDDDAAAEGDADGDPDDDDPDDEVDDEADDEADEDDGVED